MNKYGYILSALWLLSGCAQRESSDETIVVQMLRPDVIGHARSRYVHDFALDLNRDTVLVSHGDWVDEGHVLFERENKEVFALFYEYEFELKHLEQDLLYAQNREVKDDIEIRSLQRSIESVSFKMKNLTFYEVFVSSFSGFVMIEGSQLRLFSDVRDVVVEMSDFQIKEWTKDACYSIYHMDGEALGSACLAFVLPSDALIHKAYFKHEVSLYENQAVLVALNEARVILDEAYVAVIDNDLYVFNENGERILVQGRAKGSSHYEITAGIENGQVLQRVQDDD